MSTDLKMGDAKPAVMPGREIRENFMPPQPPFAAAQGFAVKPPLGIIPRKLCVEKRLHEIVEAISRYHQGNYTIPVEWFEEASEIGRWLEQQNTKGQQ